MSCGETPASAKTAWSRASLDERVDVSDLAFSVTHSGGDEQVRTSRAQANAASTNGNPMRVVRRDAFDHSGRGTTPNIEATVEPK